MTQEEQIEKVRELEDEAQTARMLLEQKCFQVKQVQDEETFLFNDLSRAEFNLGVEQDKLLAIIRGK